MSRLLELLRGFAERVNAQASLRTTLAGWSPDFFIEARDTGDIFQVRVERGQVEDVLHATADLADDALLLRADAATLERIFTGMLSPLGAYTDGLLEVYGNPKDQIKLDVIALVVWGA
ncbi:MAG TPA: hypothetical protein VGJ35_06770 [Burkholderiaceae bacterium]